ncbi:hypothetical protein Patl1_35794 [Pistacia atlantica]|nr:hypothetical protein Patl1_35794 [Pistacia atlantica]
MIISKKLYKLARKWQRMALAKHRRISELLRMSEEEFGLPSKGAIILPCDSALLEYVISLIQRHMPEELENAVLTSMATCHHLASSSLAQGQSHQQTLIFSY